MTDPAEIHDRLAALYREREKVKARLAEIEREIAATWDELPEGPDAPGLRAGRRIGTVGTMNAAPVRSRGAAVSEAKTAKATRTLFQERLHALKVSLPEWVATQRDLSVEVAKSWVKRPGHGGRAVPRRWADIAARDLKEPRLKLHESWPNGIRE